MAMKRLPTLKSSPAQMISATLPTMAERAIDPPSTHVAVQKVFPFPVVHGGAASASAYLEIACERSA